MAPILRPVAVVWERLGDQGAKRCDDSLIHGETAAMGVAAPVSVALVDQEPCLHARRTTLLTLQGRSPSPRRGNQASNLQMCSRLVLAASLRIDGACDLRRL